MLAFLMPADVRRSFMRPPVLGSMDEKGVRDPRYRPAEREELIGAVRTSFVFGAVPRTQRTASP
jgi:hypothetical protein